MTLKTTSINVYYERIKKVSRKLEKHSVFILFSPKAVIRNKDIYYTYRNSSDLLYLTGINQENIILVIQSSNTDNPKNKPKFDIFFEEKTEEEIRWTGPVLSKQEIFEKLNMPSLRNLHKYETFWKTLPRFLKNKINLYHTLGENTSIDTQLIRQTNNLSKRSKGTNFSITTIIQNKVILDEMRIIKDGFEIKKVKKACNISSVAFKSLMKFTRKQLARNRSKNKKVLHEYEVKSFIESQFKKKGSQALAYASITAIGSNATFLHYEKENTQANQNDLVLVDAGCEWDGYASDITRTFPLSGKFTSAQKKIYTIVLTAQKEAIKRCVMGYTLDDVHQIAVEKLVDGLWDIGLFEKLPIRLQKKKLSPSLSKSNSSQQKYFSAKSKEEVLEKKYYSLYYMHRTSHFMGLDVHDVGSYYISKKSRSLEEGMIFTVEPGLYFPVEYDFISDEYKGIGIRIEDDILITKNGNKVLTFAPKEINEIEEL